MHLHLTIYPFLSIKEMIFCLMEHTSLNNLRLITSFLVLKTSCNESEMVIQRNSKQTITLTISCT